MIIQGRRPKITEILMQIVLAIIIFLVIAPSIVSADSKFLPLAMFFLIALSVGSRIQAYRRPPCAAMESGEFSWRLSSQVTLKTPAANIASIDLRAGRMAVLFHDANAVWPARSRQWLTDNLQKSGCHAATGRGVFSLEQVNQLRSALGMLPQTVDDLADFEALLGRLTPRVVVTPALVAMNVAIFVAMAASGAGILLPDPTKMIQWGANLGPLTRDGQWWRLSTSLFLHFGVLHLAVNMYALRVIGPVVERLLGNTGFAIGYLVSGFFGSVASAWWHDVRISAGASGAIFGVFGMLLGFVTGRKRSLPADLIKEHRANAVVFLLFNLGLAYGNASIDQAAHLGGFAAGCLCGLILSCDLRVAAGGRAVRNLILGVVASAAAIGAVFLLSSRAPDVTTLSRRADNADKRAASVYAAALERQRSGAQTAVQTSSQIRQEILPLYTDLADQLDRLPRQSDEKLRSIHSMLVEFIRLRREGWELAGKALENNDIVSEGRARLSFEEALRTSAANKPAGNNQQIIAPTDLRTEIAVLSVSEAEATQAFSSLHESSRHGLTDEEAARAIERDVLPAWQAGRQRITQAARNLPSQDQPTTERALKYLDLRIAGLSLIVQSLREHDQAKGAAGQRKMDEADAAAKEIWQPQTTEEQNAEKN